MKCKIIYLILIILVSNANIVLAKYDEPKNFLHEMSIWNKNIDEDTYFTRYTAVVELCESVGLTLETNNDITYQNYYAPPFEDMINFEPYIRFAERKFVNGEVVDGKKYFYPKRLITYGEACAFILRCLDCRDEIKDKSLEETWEYAKKIGIISKDDEFSDKMNQMITYSDWGTMLSRLLQQSAYIDAGNNIDLTGLTYYDVLKKIKKTSFNIYRLSPEDLQNLTLATEENIKGEDLPDNKRVVMVMCSYGLDYFNTELWNGISCNYTIKENKKYYYPTEFYYFRQNFNEEGVFDGTWSYKIETDKISQDNMDNINVGFDGKVINDPRDGIGKKCIDSFDENGNPCIVEYNSDIFLVAYLEDVL